MSKKINTTSIGLFIVAGVALGVSGLLLFSSSKWFSTTRESIAYFDGSLNGLDEGAPVKFRGVRIGTVKRVMVQFNQATNDFAMPVILEIEDRLLLQRMPATEDIFNPASLASRVEHGLRATLEAESLVTGLLYVGIDIYPESPPPVYHQLQEVYPELPTVPTRTQQLLNNLASFDLKGVETNLNAVLVRIEAGIGQLSLSDTTRGVSNLLDSANRLVSSADIAKGLAAVGPTLDQYRELGAKLTGRIEPVADSVTNSLAEANRALAQIRGASENLRTMLEPDAPLGNDLALALRQIADAAQSLASFIEFLNRHPNALITGREPFRPKP